MAARKLSCSRCSRQFVARDLELFVDICECGSCPPRDLYLCVDCIVAIDAGAPLPRPPFDDLRHAPRA